mgnify:CR=1 FL=1
MIQQGKYKGLDSIILENNFLKIEVIPQYGGKMVSFYHKQTEREFLFQSKEAKLELPDYGADFSEYDASGFDEVFPSIDASFYPKDSKWGGASIPDHGEVWTLPWVLEINDEKIKLVVISPKFPYKLEKEIKLKEKKVHIDYTVTNFSKQEFKFIWCAHALLNCDTKHTKMILPPGENKVMNVGTNSELGDWGAIHDYPVTKTKTGQEIDLSRIAPKSANNCEKFYVPQQLNTGYCGVEYQDSKERLMYSFPVDKVPYLGVWKTQGGYRGDYNIALEPCTGVYDDLYLADKIDKVAVVEGQDSYEWYLEMKTETY